MMKIFCKGLFVAVAASSALAGCASSPQREVPVADPASSRMLSESAQRASSAQEQLARIQAARTAPAPKPVAENLAGVPAEMRRPTTIEWSGPGEEAARRVAHIVGYDFSVIGQAPATMPMVDVSYSGAPAVKVFEDIGYQSAPFAQVVVDARTRRVEYRYVGSDTARAPRPGMTK